MEMNDTAKKLADAAHKKYRDHMDEVARLMKDADIDEETWKEAEISGTVLLEIIRQYSLTAENAKTMINNNKDILKRIPFGIVCCITLGDDVMFQQVQGKANAVELAMDSLEHSIKELGK